MNLFILATAILLSLIALTRSTVITMEQQIQLVCNNNTTCMNNLPNPIDGIMVYKESLSTGTWLSFGLDDPSTLFACSANRYIDPIDNELCDLYQNKITIKNKCRGKFTQACIYGGLSVPPCCTWFFINLWIKNVSCQNFNAASYFCRRAPIASIFLFLEHFSWQSVLFSWQSV